LFLNSLPLPCDPFFLESRKFLARDLYQVGSSLDSPHRKKIGLWWRFGSVRRVFVTIRAMWVPLLFGRARVVLLRCE
jgi:hypothetical protein